VITLPGASNKFTFAGPLNLATGASLKFTVTATIAAHPVMNLHNGGGAVAYASIVPITGSAETKGDLPLVAASRCSAW
jgi:hypothetical protein